MSLPPRPFRVLALAAVALTLALVILGAVVRVANAGMGCPDWPLCYGRWLPPWQDGAAVLEWQHRTVAALVSAGAVAVLAAIAWSAPRRARLGGPALLVVVALVAQIALGAYTVAASNSPPSVAAHLAMGYVFLGGLLAIARRSVVRAPSKPVAPVVALAATAAATAALAQAFLGALVAASYAGRVCPDFPTCYGALAPALAGPVGLQMAHRYGAAAVVVAVCLAFHAARRGRGAVRFALAVALGLVGLQAAVGIAAVLGPFTVGVRVLHQVGAVATFIACWLAADAAIERRAAARSPG